MYNKNGNNLLLWITLLAILASNIYYGERESSTFSVSYYPKDEASHGYTPEEYKEGDKVVDELKSVLDHEGESVRILGYLFYGNDLLDVFLSTESSEMITIHLNSEGLGIMTASVNYEGFTQGESQWYTLPDDEIELWHMLDEHVYANTWFTYEVHSVDDQFLKLFLKEEYEDTDRDMSLIYVMNQAGFEYDACSTYAPAEILEECLIPYYFDWGTKEELEDFAEFVDLPLSTSDYYEKFGYPYIEGFNDQQVESMVDFSDTTIDVSILGYSRSFWYDDEQFTLMVYKPGNVPDEFKYLAEQYPSNIYMGDREIDVIEFINYDQYDHGMIFRYEGEDSWESWEVVIPEGYTVAFLRDVVEPTCKCWSPLIDYTVVGVYR